MNGVPGVLNIDDACLERAREVAKSKIGGTWISATFEELRTCFKGFEDLQKIAGDALNSCKRDRKLRLLRLTNTLTTIYEYAPAIDVVAQANVISAFIWGFLRFTLKATIQILKASPEIADSLNDIIERVRLSEVELKIYSHSHRVFEATAGFLGNAVCCLFEFMSFLRLSSWKRAAAALRFTSSSPHKVNRHLAALKAAYERLSTVIRCAQGEGQLELKTEVSGMKAVFKSTLDAHQKSSSDTNERLASIMYRTEAEKNLRRLSKWMLKEVPDAQNTFSMVPGTCAGFRNTKEFQKWETSGCKGCLPILGPTGQFTPTDFQFGQSKVLNTPGCGKSTAAYYLAKAEQTVAVMKCSLSSPNRSNLPATSRCAVQLFADLIRKIDLKDSRFFPLIQEIMPLTRYYSKGIECDSELLFNALDKFLELIPKFTIIVDALDEYLSSDNYDIQDFRRLLIYLNAVGSRPTSRVFVFSLPSIDFGDAFGTVPVYLTPAIVESDLLLFIEQEIEKIGRTNPLIMQSKSHIVSGVSTKCQGSFVMAGFVLSNLDGVKNEENIATILDEFPQQLTEVYQVLLDKIGKRLSGKEKEERRCIFMILVGAFEPFGVEDISSILAFDSKSYSATSGQLMTDTATKVLQLCWPLLMIKDDQVTYSHSSAKEFLATSVVTKDQSDEFLSRKCLRKLNEPQYKDREYSARLLRKNLDQSDSVKGHEHRPLTSSNFYFYACLHWVEHVTALANPPEDILLELFRFLTGVQYVSSSETLFQLRPKSGIGLQVQFKSALSGWYDKLSAELKERIPIEEFFVESHEDLSNELLEAGTDKVVPYLPLIRLGQYFNVGGRTALDFQKSYQYKEKVVRGLKEVLGVQHPLTLRAETEFYKEFFFPKRFDEAVQGFREVADLQGSVVGKSSLDYLNTLQLLSLALLSVTEFSEAVETSTEASEGFRNRIGSESTQTLQSEMFRGEALERQAKFEEAYKVQDEALKLWIPIGGERHPLTQGLKTALASASRQLRDYSTAKHALLQALTWRERLFTADNVTYIDTVIQVATVEYGSGKLKDCLEYLDLISSSNGLKEEFERLCQVIHIRALVDIAEGHYNRAREALQRLVHETGKEQTNRELLWIFITLADVLRRCGEDDEALMLFSGLVTRTESGEPPPLDAQISHWSLDDEPEPPAQLALAEEGLRLVRDAKPEQAKSLLRQNGLKWKRNKDFWILVGGPITDTASISALEPDEPEGWSALSSWSRPVTEETCLLSPRERSHFYAVRGINLSDGQTSGGAKTISTPSSTIQAPDQVLAA